MNREEAVRIQKYLLDADISLGHARMAIAGFAKEERLALDDVLRDIVEALHLDLLGQIYDQYPDLEPPPRDEEVPTISTSLTWDQVRLPPSVTEADLDGIIFSLLKPRWQKPAMVVILAMQRCRERALTIGDEEIAARLQVLSVPIASKESAISACGAIAKCD